MRIGFDFDNTIVNYNQIFHKVASEQGLIDECIPVNKLAVRDYLRSVDKEDIWTTMQGYVYGARMAEACMYADVVDSMLRLKNAGHTLYIISHKTRHPYQGPQYDLHSAAQAWIAQQLCHQGLPLIANEHIFFELTKEEKIARIEHLACDVFIDDLPEILLAQTFPRHTQAFLFDPDQHHMALNIPHINVVSSWRSFESTLS